VRKSQVVGINVWCEWLAIQPGKPLKTYLAGILSLAPLNTFPAQLFPVLRQLSAEDFLSGAEIAQRLSCSRSTVHNAIQAALAAGLAIHAVHGRGYRLAAPVSWLDAERVSQAFMQRGIAHRHHDQLGSTNALMLEWAALIGPERAPNRALISAEWQSQGRGRRGRDWHAGLGGGLMFSFLWRSARPAAQLSGLSLAVGVALVTALRALGVADAQVKWPNDIQVAGAKLAGVLIELASERAGNEGFSSDVLGPSTAVIGVGVNVSGSEALAQQLGHAVTDLHTQLNSAAGPVDRNELLIRLVTQLDMDLARFERDGFVTFLDDWQAFHAHQDRPVCMHTGQGEAIFGIARGVDAQGALLLETPSELRSFHSGEVSLRAVSA
jgi:BirA family biotin operon repressor/biotin-[acetyl-CoA-carboxylase] ligase